MCTGFSEANGSCSTICTGRGVLAPASAGRRHRLPSSSSSPAVGVMQPGQHPGQRGLAGAALADHRGDRRARAAPATRPRPRARRTRRPRPPGGRGSAWSGRGPPAPARPCREAGSCAVWVMTPPAGRLGTSRASRAACGSALDPAARSGRASAAGTCADCGSCSQQATCAGSAARHRPGACGTSSGIRPPSTGPWRTGSAGGTRSRTGSPQVRRRAGDAGHRLPLAVHAAGTS